MRDDDDDRARKPCRFDALRSASSPSTSRLDVGSSSTIRKGDPNSARASPMRCRWPDRKRHSALPDQRIVAFRQAGDQRMRTGAARRRHHRVGIGMRGEPGDVLGHRAVEELDILRQVADMPAELVWLPLRQFGAVEPDAALERRQDADERARERRFSGAARPDDPERRAARSEKSDAAEQRAVGRRRGDRQVARLRATISAAAAGPRLARIKTLLTLHPTGAGNER